MLRKRSLLKTKRILCIMGCIACIMFGTVSFAKTYVGNVPSLSYTKSGIKVTGNASYLYRVSKDKISSYAAIGGENFGHTTKSGPFNGVKMKSDFTGTSCDSKVYDGKRSASNSQSISTSNTSATVSYYIEGSKQASFTLLGN